MRTRDLFGPAGLGFQWFLSVLALLTSPYDPDFLGNPVVHQSLMGKKGKIQLKIIFQKQLSDAGLRKPTYCFATSSETKFQVSNLFITSKT